MENAGSLLSKARRVVLGSEAATKTQASSSTSGMLVPLGSEHASSGTAAWKAVTLCLLLTPEPRIGI